VRYTARREELRARTHAVFGWVANGQLQVSVGGRYVLADAREAHQALESRRITGKLLLLTRRWSSTQTTPPSRRRRGSCSTGSRAIGELVGADGNHFDYYDSPAQIDTAVANVTRSFRTYLGC
jgi:hypothetical protein